MFIYGNLIHSKLIFPNFIPPRNRNILIILLILNCSPFPTKIAIKMTGINLQTSFIPIWNPDNQGYKIDNEKSEWIQPQSPKNGLEKKCADFIFH